MSRFEAVEIDLRASSSLRLTHALQTVYLDFYRIIPGSDALFVCRSVVLNPIY
jgi:hypothetical protein